METIIKILQILKVLTFLRPQVSKLPKLLVRIILFLVNLPSHNKIKLMDKKTKILVKINT